MAEQPTIVTVKRAVPAETVNVNGTGNDPQMLTDTLRPRDYFDVTREYAGEESSKGWVVLRETDGLVPWTFWVRPADYARAIA